MLSNTTNYSFNGSNTVHYDEIKFCPYCGEPIKNDFKYCSQCGKEIPRTTTRGMIIYHWNTPEGTITYPRNGIISPYTTC